MSSLSSTSKTKGKPVDHNLWQWDGPPALTGCGGRDLLELELTAFFASRLCPGSAIRAGLGWALQQASAKRAVVSGFHSPLEQSVLKVLLAAGSPTVVVLARPVQGASLPSAWSKPLEEGRMAIVGSATALAGRLTQTLATDRNALAARLAARMVVAHASPNGSLAAQVICWRQEGMQLEVFVP